MPPNRVTASRPHDVLLWSTSCQGSTRLREQPFKRYTTMISCARRSTMEIPRPAPPRSAPEREMLEAWLDFHRITLERKCSGVSPEQLRRRAVPPSAFFLLDDTPHMAIYARSLLGGLPFVEG